MPSAIELARLSSDEHRRMARRRRRQNRLVGWFVASLALCGVVAAGYVGYREFESDDGSATQPSGIAGALGGALDSVEGLDHQTLANGLPLTGELTLAEVTTYDVLPTFVVGAADDLGVVDGLHRYTVDVGDLADLEPELTDDWLAVLGALPQAPVDPTVDAAGSGELALGIVTDGSAVRRLVVQSGEPPLRIDTAS